jgi:RNA-directed DNA polymerase
MARRTRTWRGRSPLAGTETSGAGLGRPCVWPCPSPQGPHGAPHGHDRDAPTQGVGQFHSTRAATEPREPGARQNQQAQAITAEVGEGRELAQGTLGQHNRGRTQCRAALSRALDRGGQAARASAIRLTALWQQVYAIDRLRAASNSRKYEAAPGGEGQTWAADGEQRAPNLREVADRLKRGGYQAPPVERVSIPQAEGRQRPSGTPPLEDNSVQRAPVEGLNAIDEQACLGCSYGARPGRSPHHALAAVTVGSEQRHSNWGLEADMRGFDEAIAHEGLGPFVEHRMGDQGVVRPIRQGLKVGVLEAGP